HGRELGQHHTVRQHRVLSEYRRQKLPRFESATQAGGIRHSSDFERTSNGYAFGARIRLSRMQGAASWGFSGVSPAARRHVLGPCTTPLHSLTSFTMMRCFTRHAARESDTIPSCGMHMENGEDESDRKSVVEGK